MVKAVDNYFELLQSFEKTLYDWHKEIDEMQAYKEKTKAEGKSILFIDIRLNKAQQKIQAIQALTTAATTAINELQHIQAIIHSKQHYNEPAAPARLQLKDMPAMSMEKMVEKILNILQDEFG